MLYSGLSLVWLMEWAIYLHSPIIANKSKPCIDFKEPWSTSYCKCYAQWCIKHRWVENQSFFPAKQYISVLRKFVILEAFDHTCIKIETIYLLNLSMGLLCLCALVISMQMPIFLAFNHECMKIFQGLYLNKSDCIFLYMFLKTKQ